MQPFDVPSNRQCGGDAADTRRGPVRGNFSHEALDLLRASREPRGRRVVRVRDRHAAEQVDEALRMIDLFLQERGVEGSKLGQAASLVLAPYRPHTDEVS